MSPRPIITLTTDFGLRDEYVGTVKGVLLNICRHAAIVDLTHHIDPQDIAQAADCIGHSYRFFPSGTVHLVVVDPGVGSDRRILALKACNHLFVAPDNGVLTPFLNEERFQDAFVLTNAELFSKSVSSTFHGRDIMAPVAARLAVGMDISLVGPQLKQKECQRIELPKALIRDNKITGTVVHIDHFGNLQTSITKEDTALFSKQKLSIQIGGHTIIGIRTAYYESARGKSVALFDSRDLLEIAINGGNAAITLGCGLGSEVIVSSLSEM